MNLNAQDNGGLDTNVGHEPTGAICTAIPLALLAAFRRVVEAKNVALQS